MPEYVQTSRDLQVTTPLENNVLLLTGVNGREAISELFQFEFEFIAENKSDVVFDKLLGQPITAHLSIGAGASRHISGIVSRFAQSGRDKTFTSYRAEVVPALWLLTRRRQSRIFQYITVPDILKKVLAGLTVSWEIQGTFEQRDFCVQYRETDFNFASRLMEEEGIYYYFTHTDKDHTLVVANTPQSHLDAVPPNAIFEEIVGGNRPEERIYNWERSQELRSGKSTLWDHCFELPHQHLEGTKSTIESAPVGTLTHKLHLANNEKLELYDFPGRYAQRFDGVTSGGGAASSSISKIFPDATRTVEIRQQEESAQAIQINGNSSCPQFTPGYRFKLERHFNANGTYVFTSVHHSAQLSGEYRSGGPSHLEYENSFACIPVAVPFRPARVTPIPLAPGPQTAVVVGPGGQEIFCDKYSRIKVQFHWDREGQSDGASSCWVRVATPWAGKQWGMIHIPRMGQEVVVDFEEGDMDRPIVVGSVYNAEMMPPYTLPDNKTQSGIKTRSTMEGTPETFNEICFEDKKGSELLYIRAEKDQINSVENDEALWVGHDRDKEIDHDETTQVHHDRTETVDNNETITIHGNRTETVDKDETITIHKNRTETVDKDETITITGNRTEKVDKNETVTITKNRDVTISQGNESLTVKMGNASTKITMGKSETEAMQSIELKVGPSTIKIDPSGITMEAMMIKINGKMMVQVKAGLLQQLKSDLLMDIDGTITMIN